MPRRIRLAVASDLKRTGLGSLLIGAVESVARERGCPGLRLTVAAEHPFLPGLYARKGFVIIGPRVPPNPLYPEIVMQKDFSAVLPR